MFQDGQTLGDFEILGRLGQGGMGAVYKARQVSLERLVALKTLQASLAGDPDYIARFHHEAVAAAGLNHPNLVQVYAAGENDGLHWFAMEYVEGESAQGRLKRKGRIEPVEAIAIAMHVATALDYGWRKAHLIHRDVKPDNIFLSGDGEVKLGDLGLAKSAGQTEGLTMTGASMGTPNYISPEQAEGKKDTDLHTDIYSLGCTLYHMLSGQPPYAGDGALAVMMKHVNAPVPDLRSVWPECPAELASAVGKMMQKRPAERQQSYAEVTADLRRAYNGARGPSANPAGMKKRGAHVAAWAGGGIALLAAIAALVHFAPWKKRGLTEAERAEKEQSSPALQRAEPSATGGRSDGLKPPTTLPAATKDKPFVNTLGMKFVPVPGTQALFSIWDTRVADYAEYARVNKVDGSWAKEQKDGVPVSRDPEYPVVSVTWEDANAFCKWLTEKERAEGKLPKGMKYRLPTDEEWSHAVGLAKEVGATPKERSGKNQVDFPWGVGYPPKGKVGNYADETFHAKFPKDSKDKEKDVVWIKDYNDGYATTSPVGSFPANQYGLYDMGGNVWQWCEDWLDEEQNERVMRGAGFGNGNRGALLSSNRDHRAPHVRIFGTGFRCVLAPATSAPPASATAQTASGTLANATKDKPFVNTLGMKFVPVPIVSGPTAGQRVLFGVWDVRVQDYAVYAANADTKKVDDSWTKQQRDGVPAGRELNHPVVGVNWEDAQAFCKWLTEKESAEGKLLKGLKYRLPSDEEWSGAVGLPPELGATPAEKNGKNTVDYPWGKDWPPTKKVGNYADETFHLKLPKDSTDKTKDNPWIVGYNDSFATTSPVGSFPANAYGLYDIGGNVWQWCEDWFDKDHEERVMRGASWSDASRSTMLSSSRRHIDPGNRFHNGVGFRCVLGESAR